MGQGGRRGGKGGWDKECREEKDKVRNDVETLEEGGW